MAVITRNLPENKRARQTAGAMLPATLSETLTETFKTDTITDLIFSKIETDRLDPNSDRITGGIFGVDVMKQVRDITEEPEPLIDQNKLNDEFGHLGLSFDKPTSRSYAEALAEGKKREIIREDVIARGPQGIGVGTLKFGAALVRSALDPVELASAFVPIVGQARYAGMVARLGTTGARVSRGMVEGSVGAAIIEVPTFALSKQQQLDYTMSDALASIALGGVLGGGLHAIGGKIGDLVSSRKPEVRESALRAAVAHMMEGKLPNVEPIFRFDEATFSPIKSNAEIAKSLRDEVQEIASKELPKDRVSQIEQEIVAFERELDGIQADAIERDLVSQGIDPKQAKAQAASIAKRQADEVQDRIDDAKRALDDHQASFKAKEELAKLDKDLLVKDDSVEILNDSIKRIKTELPDFDVERFNPVIAISPDGKLQKPMSIPEMRREAAIIARQEAAPERDGLYDARDIEEAKAAIDKNVGAEAVEEADFADEAIRSLREAGLLTKEDERIISEAEEMVSHAEGYGRGAEAAVRCLLRG